MRPTTGGPCCVPANARASGTQIILADIRRQSPPPSARPWSDTNDEGHRRLKFSGTPDIRSELDRLGEVPLPPYIERARPNCRKTRNVTRPFSPATAGSVAAPTAGLHFTPEMLEQIRARGVKICFVTLHVGPGTFLPVKTETLAAHKMHEERFEIGEETVRAVNEAKTAGRRVIAVGTTTVRVLESVAAAKRRKTRKNLQEKRTFSFIRRLHFKSWTRC